TTTDSYSVKSKTFSGVSAWLAQAEPSNVTFTLATRSIRRSRPDEPDGEPEAADFVSVADSCSSRRHEADGRQEQASHPNRSCIRGATQLWPYPKGNRKSGVRTPHSK
ncbi:MAG: hypothetical protein ACK58T_25170, partial [Phycisphaerae bacterium]